MTQSFVESGRMRSGAVGALAMAAVAVSACGSDGDISGRTIGAGVGAAGGAAIGSTIGQGRGRIAATVVGGLLGALAGSEIGRVMDENDRLRAEEARQDALENTASGRSREWRSAENDMGGAVTPEPPFWSEDRQYCREYEETVSSGGRTESARGVACRQPDGTWRVRA